ncbi:MAG: hypothetical protein QME96_02710 [Myxococcota bacterium]|nr:hypothetical protein [Myxococcota bacterium]
MRTVAFLIGLAAAAFAPAARAGKVFINGVEVTGIANQRFENVTVRFDAQGNIHVDAPGYRVQLLDGTGRGGAPPAPTTPVYSDSGRVIYTEPSSFNRPLTATTSTTVATVAPAPPTAPAAPAQAVVAPPPAPQRSGPAPTKRYFLITQGSGGAAVAETIRVNINGLLAREIDSAGTQVIVDVTDRINLGPNSVTIMSTKKPGYAPGSSSSTFQVIVGEGRVEAGGRVVIDVPVVTYTRTAADAAAESRTYTLDGR